MTEFLAYWSGYPPLESTQKTLDLFVADTTTFHSTYYIALPFSLCLSMREKYKETPVVLGVDELLSLAEGSFTESIAVRLLAETKIPFVVLGDTDQRTTHPDSYKILSKAIQQLLQYQVTPFICFGESQEDYLNGNSRNVISNELSELLKDISPHLLMNIHLVYEASWVHQLTYKPTIEELTASYQLCRDILQEQVGTQLGNEITLLGGVPYDLDDLNQLRDQSPVNGFYFHKAGLNQEKIHQWLVNFKKVDKIASEEETVQVEETAAEEIVNQETITPESSNEVLPSEEDLSPENKEPL